MATVNCSEPIWIETWKWLEIKMSIFTIFKHTWMFLRCTENVRTCERVNARKKRNSLNRATNSCRDGWNVRNGLNVPNILHSVGERVDCVLLIVLVLSLSKHDYVPLNLNKKYCECLCSGGYINLLTLLWKTGCMGCLLCQNILVVNQKNGCLSCLICTPWNQNFHFQSMNWLLML